MQTPAKVTVAVIGVIVVVLAIMLGIGFLKGDDTHTQDGQVTSSSARVIESPAAPASPLEQAAQPHSTSNPRGELAAQHGPAS